MKHRKHILPTLAAAGLAMALLGTGGGCKSAGVQLARTDIQHPGQELFNGYTKPDVKCFYCHNGDGRGSGKGPDLSKKVPKMPDEAILKKIAEGEKDKMPAFADRTTDEERHTILAWLRQEFGKPEALPTLDEGAPEQVEDEPTTEDADH